MRYTLIALFLLITYLSFAQTQRIDSIPKDGIVLNKGWKFHTGDNIEWMKPDFDDSQWQNIDPTLDVYYLPQMRQQPIGWLRIHFHVDSSLLNKPLAYHIFQSIASQVYLNGKLANTYGVVSTDKDKIKEWRPSNDPEGIVFTQPEQTVAVRFSLQKSDYIVSVISNYNGFVFRINDVNRAAQFRELSHQFPNEYLSFFTFFFVVSIINFILYVNSSSNKGYLLFFLTYFINAVCYLFGFFVITGNVSLNFINYSQLLFYLTLYLTPFLFYLTIRAVFSSKKNFLYWMNIVLAVFCIVPMFYLIFPLPLYLILLALITLTNGIESTRITIASYRRGNKKAAILIIGFIVYWLSFSLSILAILKPELYVERTFNFPDLLWVIAIISNPLVLVIYLSLDFANTSKQLAKKLIEVEKLSSEKQQILLSQNETLELQVTQRTSQLNQSLEELKSTQQQLIQSEKMASLGELTAGIAHEIQNPLNFVNNFSEVSNEMLEEMNEELDKGDIEEAKLISNDIKQNLEKINHHGKRADAIVKGMLQHSRQSKGAKEPININALCDEYLRLSYHGLRAKDKLFNADFKTDFDESIGKINIVPQDMGRVLLNLFYNAFYATSEKQKAESLKQNEYKPLVYVQTKKINNKIEITVSDNGNGIPSNIIDKIFQPFFTTKPTGQGTGLGLSLTYDIITKEHNGTIRVESKEGKGSAFIIHLPL